VKHLALALIVCTALALNYLTDVSTDLSPKTQQGWNWTSTFVCLGAVWLWCRQERT
jgi:hypothetical protein